MKPRKHLLYFIYPLRNGEWEWNVEQLLRRVDQFDGVRACAIATRGNKIEAVDDPLAVEAVLKPHGFKCLRVLNRRAIGEVVGWRPLWGLVPDDGYTFYGHAKGVTKPQHPTEREWASIMYETLLDYPEIVEDQLDRFPVTGSLKCVGTPFRYIPTSTWHYSGSFCWSRNADAKRLGIPKLCPRKYAGTEAVWGMALAPRESGCVFHSDTQERMNMYSPLYMSKTVRPAYNMWKVR